MLDRRARVLLSALLVVAAFHAPAATAAPALQAAVLSWTDGDTARVAPSPGTVVTVRLIGIDTPETSRGEQAAQQFADRLLTQRI